MTNEIIEEKEDEEATKEQMIATAQEMLQEGQIEDGVIFYLKEKYDISEKKAIQIIGEAHGRDVWTLRTDSGEYTVVGEDAMKDKLNQLGAGVVWEIVNESEKDE